MPLIVHILAEDVALWRRCDPHSAEYIYCPVARPDREHELILASAPGPLERFLGRDMICYVNRERQPGTSVDRTRLRLLRLKRALAGQPLRLRLRISSVQAGRVWLDTFDRSKGDL